MGQMGLHLRLYAVMISTFAGGRDLCIKARTGTKDVFCFASDYGLGLSVCFWSRTMRFARLHSGFTISLALDGSA